MAKSSNSHNRLYCTVEPLEEKFSVAVENGDVPMRDKKARIRFLSEKFKWDKNDANKIWAFGPYTEGANVIVDSTQGCQFMNEIKEHMITGFE